jgi:hypothetical protein
MLVELFMLIVVIVMGATTIMFANIGEKGIAAFSGSITVVIFLLFMVITRS